ncbi:MAG: hypothetical protein Q9160_000983 [Pyrenula sp. 1 TL-2023]
MDSKDLPKHHTGRSSTDPFIIDDSDTEIDESIYLRFGLSTALSQRNQSIPVLKSSPPRQTPIQASSSDPKGPVKAFSLKHASLHPRPIQRNQQPALFHNAKKPDVRPANQKPISRAYIPKASESTFDALLGKESTSTASIPSSESASLPYQKPSTEAPPLAPATPSADNRANNFSSVGQTLTKAGQNLESRVSTISDSGVVNQSQNAESAKPVSVRKLENGWEVYQVSGKHFYVDHKTRRTQWHRPAEAFSPPASTSPSAPVKDIQKDSVSGPSVLEDSLSQALENVRVSPSYEQPTRKSPTPLPKSSSPSRPQTPITRDFQPPSQISVIIQKSPALLHGKYQDISRKRRTSDFYESGKLKRLRRSSSTSSSSSADISHHDLHLFYPYDEDDDHRKQAGQPKAKSVERALIPLDFGEPVPTHGKPLDPNNLILPEKQVDQIHRAQFLNVKGPPLTFSNEVNGKFLSENFRFVSSFRKSFDVYEGSVDGNLICDCTDDCISYMCTCLIEGKRPYCMRDGMVVLHDDLITTATQVKTEPIDKKPIDEDQGSGPGPGQSQSQSQDQVQDEDEERDERPPVIYECNQNCSCAPRCQNKVIGKGRTLPLNIFMTKMCGLGVRCPLPVAKGQFLDTYLGELITTKELDKREEVRDTAYPHGTSYSFTLDRFEDDLNDERGEGKPRIPMYQVDATKFGCPTRFINHSCEPNCRVYPSLIRLTDRRVYNLAFFAIRDIAANEELTIDYDPQGAGAAWDENDFLDDPDMKRCYCGTKKCRKLLWAPPTKSRRRGRPRLGD